MYVRLLLAAIAALLVSLPGHAESLRDLASRIDYGFYGDDEAVVAAAATALEGLRSNNAEAGYLYALAQFRLAELRGHDARAVDALSRCLDTAQDLTKADEADAEAQVLVAVCSLQLAGLENLRSVVHERRAARALASAAAIDPANPRVAYVAALVGNDREPASDSVAALEAAAARFAESTGEGPVWGEAEVHLLLAMRYEQAGERRRARDAAEHAVIAAPGFAQALEFRDRLAAGRQ